MDYAYSGMHIFMKMPQDFTGSFWDEKVWVLFPVESLFTGDESYLG